MTTKGSEMLLPDFYELREHLMPWRWALAPDFEGLRLEMWWIPTGIQLADNLTKRITPSAKLLYDLVNTGRMCISQYERPRSSQQALSKWVTPTGIKGPEKPATD